MAYHRKPRSSTSGNAYDTSRMTEGGSSARKSSGSRSSRSSRQSSQQQPRRSTKQMPENAKKGRKRQYGGANYQRGGNRHSSIRLGKSIYPDSSEQRRYNESRTRYDEDRARWQRQPGRFDIGDIRPIAPRGVIIVILLIVIIARAAAFGPTLDQARQLDEQVSQARETYSQTTEAGEGLQKQLEQMDETIAKYEERKTVSGG